MTLYRSALLLPNQTASINLLRLHFHPTPLSESQLKKTYPAGIPDFNASLGVSIYYPYEKGKTLSQYASDDYGFGKLLGLTTNNTLGGLPAYKSTYSSTAFFAIPERNMHIGAIKGDKVFILSYVARPNEYDKYMPIVQQMINTFQITSLSTNQCNFSIMTTTTTTNLCNFSFTRVPGGKPYAGPFP